MKRPALHPPLCSEHRTPRHWGETEFVHREDGVEVVVRHVPAWVCPQGDDVAFPPGVTDELIETVRQLVRMAKQGKIDHPLLSEQEYLVRVL
ncbi:MAG: hypothetical protein R3C14_06410 [Caldilineaceae bacterium]